METQELERTPTIESRRTESADLSAEIMRTIDREPGERVRCRRVYGDNYRCNWLALDRGNAGLDLAIDTYTIRQSKFLRVTQTAEGLAIEDLTISR